MSDSKQPILYLSGSDVAGLSLETSAVMAALEQAFRLNASGQLLSAPKSSIWIGPGEGFQSLSVVDRERKLAAMKWIGLVPPGRAATTVNASILLSDAQTGAILCFMDAQRATALRTAGMSAVAGKYLARAQSRTIGFIGAGVQAQSHLDAFASTLASLRSVRVHSANPSNARGFADLAAARGLEAVVTTADQVLESDIIVTTVPHSPSLQPFLDAARTRPGAFIAAVDLARPWIDQSLAAIDLTVIDDESMRHASKPGSFIPPLEDAQATLSDLVSGAHPGRTHADQRILLASSGSAIADLAIGNLIYRQALAGNVGQYLPQ